MSRRVQIWSIVHVTKIKYQIKLMEKTTRATVDSGTRRSLAERLIASFIVRLLRFSMFFEIREAALLRGNRSVQKKDMGTF